MRIPNIHYISEQIGTSEIHEKKCGVTPRFVANAKCVRGAERVSGVLLKYESLPGANEVGGHDRSEH